MIKLKWGMRVFGDDKSRFPSPPPFELALLIIILLIFYFLVESL